MGLILPQEVDVKIVSSSYKYYQEKGYKIPTKIGYTNKECIDMNKKIKIHVLDLMPVSHIKVKIQCDYCGEFDEVEWVKVFKSFNNKISKKVSCTQCNGMKTKEIKRESILKQGKINPLYWDKDWLINEYIIQNKSANSIAIQCGVHIRRIEKYIKDYDLHKQIESRDKLPKELLYDLYINQKLTKESIQNTYCVDVTTITKLLIEYNIPIRTRSESMAIYYDERNGRILKCIKNKEVWERDGYREKQKKIFKISSNKLENRIKQSASMQGINISDWNGFLTSENAMFRNNLKYKQWVKEVFERDNYTCQCCGGRSSKGNPITLNAHHLKSFANYPELRLDINNGITLCSKCHSPQVEGSFHNIYGTRNNEPEQLYEYIDNYKKKERY